MHLDDAGLCTSTQVLTGKKYWVAFSKDSSLGKKDPTGDLGSIDWSPDFEDLYKHNLKGFLTAEAIEMGPRTLLWVVLLLISLFSHFSLIFRFQMSNVPHLVLTLEHTVTQGQHFYLTPCLQPTSHQIAHSFARRFTITNQYHEHTPTLLRRMLCCSIDWWVSGNWTSGMYSPGSSHDMY
jgi:hypothetical protein